MIVKIYSTPACPYCQMAKMFLKEKGVEFTEINVAADEAAAKEIVAKTGQVGVPVIMVDDQVIVGFNQEELEKALNLK